MEQPGPAMMSRTRSPPARSAVLSARPDPRSFRPCRCSGVDIVGAIWRGKISPTPCLEQLHGPARRQAKSCWGLSPLRRATSDTLAPGFRLSSTMRALSSARPSAAPPGPRDQLDPPHIRDGAALAVIGRSLVSVRLSLWSKSIAHGLALSHARATPKCGVGAPLTIDNPEAEARRYGATTLRSWRRTSEKIGSAATYERRDAVSGPKPAVFDPMRTFGPVKDPKPQYRLWSDSTRRIWLRPVPRANPLVTPASR